MRRGLTVLAAAGAAVIAGATPALAHNCDVYINPEDCGNTAWTVGIAATIAAAGAAVTGLVRSGTKGPMPRDEGECGAEIHDLDGRLNRVIHSIESSIDLFNRAAMKVEESFASALHALDVTGSTVTLDAARQERAGLLEGIPDIKRMMAEAQELYARRQAVYAHCRSSGNLPAGTWNRPAPGYAPLFQLPDYGPGNRPAIPAPGVRTPQNHDQLVNSLSQPGTTVIDPTNAHNLGPPEYVGEDGRLRVPPDAPGWARTFDGTKIPAADIENGTIQVSLGLAGARVRLVNDDGRLALDGRYEVPLGGGDVDDLDRLQEELDRMNRRMEDAGIRVTRVGASGSQIRIETGPLEE